MLFFCCYETGTTEIDAYSHTRCLHYAVTFSWRAPNDAASATGMSPMDAMSALVAGNPPTDAASVGDLITSINAAFASDPTANPAHRFEGTFFSGTPALDTSGNPSARVNTQIDPSVSLDRKSTRLNSST